MLNDLPGKTILITSGPTFAPIDAVRGLTNRSSGRLGSELARTFSQHGAQVILLAGETSLIPQTAYPGEDSSRIQVERFTTVPQLKQQIKGRLTSGGIDAVLMAAAVLDYLPVETVEGKKRSSGDSWTVTFKRGEKIIERIRHWAPDVFLVGFKLETAISLDELTARAGDLIQRSGAGLVVANRLEEIDSEHHTAYLIEPDADGNLNASPPIETRQAIAEAIAECLYRHFA